MGIARSTFYDKPAPQDDTAIVEVISGICEEFEFYGWRRVRAELRHRGLIVNHKKVRRLMREHDLQPRRRRRCVATTDSDHDQPIYPNRAKDLAIDGPDQLWVADITYVAIREGFAYVAVILDAWSRRAIGYAISRSIDVRLTLAALNTAVERRKPPPGCIHHSDRGSQYAAQGYREALLRHGFVGSMGRRGNPYDNPKAESFMKTLKVEAVYPMAYETFADVANDLPNSSTRSTTLVVSTQRWAISARSSSRISIPGLWSNQPPKLCPPQGAHSIGRNTRDVLNLVHELEEKLASLRVREPAIDTGGAMGRMVLTVLGMVAEMELGFIRDRPTALAAAGCLGSGLVEPGIAEPDPARPGGCERGLGAGGDHGALFLGPARRTSAGRRDQRPSRVRN